MLSGNSRLSARVSTQAAEFGNDPIVQTAGPCFYTKTADFRDASRLRGSPPLCLLWQPRPLWVSVCVSLCIRVCACVHIGGADYKKTVFHVFLCPFFSLKRPLTRQYNLSQHFLSANHPDLPPKCFTFSDKPPSTKWWRIDWLMATHSKPQTVMWNMAVMWTNDIFGYLCVLRVDEMINLYRDILNVLLDPSKMPHNAVTACILYYTHGIYLFL